MKHKALYGTHDILPDESFKWQNFEDKLRSIFALYNYKEIRTPIFEETELFTRSIGQDTDIVQKEMYTFLDQGKRSITLRPEGTAGVVRAYLEHNLGKKAPLVKVYYFGSMFRQERPQKGRLREFHQFGIEAIGSTDSRLDAEVIEMAVKICEDVGITDYRLHLNSIGCPICRPVHRDKLLEFMRDKVGELCDDCKTRFMRNPLRMFDCKKKECAEQLRDAPVMLDFLCYHCRFHHDNVKRYLDGLELAYIEDKRLVRGLDYYTRTAFEIKSALLGSQDTLCGGGRYDLLVQELGGQSTPAIGFAAGIERFMLAMEMKKQSDEQQKTDVFIAIEGDDARALSVKLSRDLRHKNIICETDYMYRSLKAQMREADRQKVKKVLILGEEETRKGKAVLRDMQTGEQKEINLSEIERIWL